MRLPLRREYRYGETSWAEDTDPCKIPKQKKSKIKNYRAITTHHKLDIQTNIALQKNDIIKSTHQNQELWILWKRYHWSWRFCRRYAIIEFCWLNVKFENPFTSCLHPSDLSQVFKGRDIHSKKEVAVKRVLKKKIDHQVKLWRGLKTEVNILSRNDIDRHHITKLFLFDETEDYYFEILELCETDLKKVIRKRRNLILSESLDSFFFFCNWMRWLML